jgi:hypothetical protein
VTSRISLQDAFCPLKFKRSLLHLTRSIKAGAPLTADQALIRLSHIFTRAGVATETIDTNARTIVEANTENAITCYCRP